MFILHVSIHVKPEFAGPFLEATRENASNSIREPGVARFDVLRHSDDPNRFALWEVYRTEEAIAAHKSTPHYAKWTETVADMMAEPRTRIWYSSVYPGDEAW